MTELLIPKSLDSAINDIKNGFLDILKDNLVGVYLHGSVAMNCFNMNSSDIDFLVVVQKPISITTKKKIIKLLLDLSDKYKISKGFEMSIVLERYTRNFVYPTPFLLHYSKDCEQKYRNNEIDYKNTEHQDPDLAAHFTVVKSRGICIYGKQIDQVFGDVPREDYINSLIYDVADAQESISDNPVYYILNLCRIVQFLETNKVTSKLEGGKWGLKNLPKDFHKIVKEATKIYKGEKKKHDFKKEELKNFASYMLNRINGK